MTERANTMLEDLFNAVKGYPKGSYQWYNAAMRALNRIDGLTPEQYEDAVKRICKIMRV